MATQIILRNVILKHDIPVNTKWRCNSRISIL
jgi:hypothetical protein